MAGRLALLSVRVVLPFSLPVQSSGFRGAVPLVRTHGVRVTAVSESIVDVLNLLVSVPLLYDHHAGSDAGFGPLPACVLMGVVTQN